MPDEVKDKLELGLPAVAWSRLAAVAFTAWAGVVWWIGQQVVSSNKELLIGQGVLSAKIVAVAADVAALRGAMEARLGIVEARQNDVRERLRTAEEDVSELKIEVARGSHSR